MTTCRACWSFCCLTKQHSWSPATRRGWERGKRSFLPRSTDPAHDAAGICVPQRRRPRWQRARAEHARNGRAFALRSCFKEPPPSSSTPTASLTRSLPPRSAGRRRIEVVKVPAVRGATCVESLARVVCDMTAAVLASCGAVHQMSTSCPGGARGLRPTSRRSRAWKPCHALNVKPLSFKEGRAGAGMS